MLGRSHCGIGSFSELFQLLERAGMSFAVHLGWENEG